MYCGQRESSEENDICLLHRDALLASLYWPTYSHTQCSGGQSAGQGMPLPTLRDSNRSSQTIDTFKVGMPVLVGEKGSHDESQSRAQVHSSSQSLSGDTLRCSCARCEESGGHALARLVYPVVAGGTPVDQITLPHQHVACRGRQRSHVRPRHVPLRLHVEPVRGPVEEWVVAGRYHVHAAVLRRYVHDRNPHAENTQLTVCTVAV
mmetsp:Transcript_147909/g.457363  ORF Transcript_147909/g.457363 Transcript_147909/m.457363 type:complete len:206 (-) Transcript_147909:108-725(-)